MKKIFFGKKIFLVVEGWGRLGRVGEVGVGQEMGGDSWGRLG